MKRLFKSRLATEKLERTLIVLLRALSLIFMAMGVREWMIILDVTNSGFYGSMARSQQTITGYFAVINLVASVGLWLISSWGSVVWLLAALSDIILHFMFPQYAVTPRFIILFHLASMLAYAWLATTLERQRTS